MKENNTATGKLELPALPRPLSPARKTYRKFLAFRHWGFMLKAMPRELEFMERFSFQRVHPTFRKIRRQHGLDEPLTMRTFRRICRKENITVLFGDLSPVESKVPETNLHGIYSPEQPKMVAVIVISSKVPKSKVLMVAAHELSHHFLHRKQMKAGTVGFRVGESKTDRTLERRASDMTNEMAADALACLLITKEAYHAKES
jgi:hypothetical protein